MKGAIIGDLVGSRFEFNNLQEWEWDFDFLHPLCHFTDDSLMTIAIAKTLVECRYDSAAIRPMVVENMRLIAHRHPNVGWGRDSTNGFSRMNIRCPITATEMARQCA